MGKEDKEEEYLIRKRCHCVDIEKREKVFFKGPINQCEILLKLKRSTITYNGRVNPGLDYLFPEETCS